MKLRTFFNIDPIALSITAMFLGLSLILSWTKLLTLWYQIPTLVLGLLLGLSAVEIDRRYLHHLYRSSESSGLVTQSILFLGLFFFVSLFVVTSTGSIFGGGIVIGLLATTTAGILKLRSDKARLEQTYFFQLKRPLTLLEVQVITTGVIVWNVLVWFFALVQ